MEGNIDKVIEALKPIAEKIGQGAEFLYSIYYRQIIVEGILQVVLSIVGLIIMAVLLKKAISYYPKAVADAKKRHDKQWAGLRFDTSDALMGTMHVMIPIVITIVVIVPLALTSLVEGSMKLGNPHFYTIQRIIDNVKDKEIK